MKRDIFKEKLISDLLCEHSTHIYCYDMFIKIIKVKKSKIFTESFWEILEAIFRILKFFPWNFSKTLQIEKISSSFGTIGSIERAINCWLDVTKAAIAKNIS